MIRVSGTLAEGDRALDFPNFMAGPFPDAEQENDKE